MSIDIVKKLAASLDSDNFNVTQSLLSKNCVYEIGTQKFVGPAEIVGSYKEHTTYAKNTFDKVVYESSIKTISNNEFEITYTDVLLKSGRTHTYTCKQFVTVIDSLVAQIKHQEIPGEYEKLKQYYLSVGL